ncbi:MAG: hypothetical protein Q4A07_04005 [Coriobacteriales bacterium]|nr:hypothetical protein [Coriobacteriales bacterium]
MKDNERVPQVNRILRRAATVLMVGMLFALCATPAFALGRGSKFSVNGNTYRVTEYDAKDKDGDVTLVSYGATSTKPTINTVKYKGIRFDVDTIGRAAFNTKRGRKVTSIKLGSKVDRIQSKAFYGTKQLKAIYMGASDVVDLDKERDAWKIDNIDAARDAFTGAGAKKLTIHCGKKARAYQNLYGKALMSKGLRKDAIIVK